MFLYYFELSFQVSAFPVEGSRIENLFNIREATNIMQESFREINETQSIPESQRVRLTPNTSMVECDAANNIVKIRFSICSSFSSKSLSKVRTRCVAVAEQMTGCRIERSSCRLAKSDPDYGDSLYFSVAACSA